MNSKILIVEDEEIEAMKCEQSLKSYGYDVVGIASTGEEALKKVDELSPDLVLMNIVLKGEIDGIEAAARIIEDFDIPVVYLTVHTENSEVNRTKLNTPYIYLTKPVRKNDVKNTVKLALYKHQIEVILSKSENKYRKLFENTNDSVIFRNTDFKILDANKSACQMFGYPYHDFVGKYFEELIHSSCHGLLSQVKEKIKKHGYCDYEIIFLDKNGNKIYTEVTGRIINFINQDDVLTIIRDITAQKELEKKLIEREELFRTVADFTYDWEYWIGPDKKLIYISPSCERITGYTREEFIEDPILIEKIVHPDDIEKIGKHLHETSKNKNYEIRTYRIITKQGEEKWIGHGCRPVYNDKGGFKGRRVSNRDITSRIKTEIELRESEDFLNNIVENIPNMIFVKNADDLSFKRVNKAGEIYFGHPRSDLIGKNDYDFFPKKVADFFTQKDWKVLQTGELLDIPEETILTKKLGSRILHTKKIPLIDKEGNPQFLLGISEDITDRKKAENEIVKSLQEKEILLKEIHHRVKNNLQIISSLLDLQKDYVKDDPKAVSVLEESKNRVLSMAMIHEMIYLSEDLSHINFSDYIKRMLNNLFDSYMVKDVELKINVQQIYLNIETGVPLGLIISELVSNSLKYAFPYEEKGNITVELQENNVYELIISDNGVGIPEEIDFDTESTLGLRLVNSLVNQLDGIIQLERTKGTKYTIKFKELTYKKRI